MNKVCEISNIEFYTIYTLYLQIYIYIIIYNYIQIPKNINMNNIVLFYLIVFILS